MAFGAGHYGYVPPAEVTPALETAASIRILPRITDAATDYIDVTVGEWRKQGNVLTAIQSGAGSSTAYLAQRFSKLVSFEHTAHWHSIIKGSLTGLGLTNIEWRTEDRPYWKHFAGYADESFDLALVDGRDRTHCVEHVRRLIKPGGVLVVDNTERIGGLDGRGVYFEMLRFLEGWDAIHFEQEPGAKDRGGWTASHRWITSVWRKPVEGKAVAYTTLGLPLLG